MTGTTRRYGSQILVLGDLCLDVLIDCASPSPIADGVTKESALRSSSLLSVGGSAWILARAAIAAGIFRPVILSAIGSDMWARQLLTSIREAGLSESSIQQIDGAPTDLVCMMTFEGRQRLMFMPTDPTGDCLEEGFVLSCLRNIDPGDTAWVWISGYALVERSSARRRSVRLLANWARENEVPVVLDLVPHEFAASVGTLEEVASFLGRPDVLVGAPSTFRDFGYSFYGDGIDGANAMMEVAARASRDWGIVVTQTHTGPSNFGQILARDGVVLSISELVIPANDLRGPGDQLALKALEQLSLLERPERGN